MITQALWTFFLPKFKILVVSLPHRWMDEKKDEEDDEWRSGKIKRDAAYLKSLRDYDEDAEQLLIDFFPKEE